MWSHTAELNVQERAAVRLEGTQYYCAQVGCPILEEWMGGEVHMAGEVVIATVKWWAALATSICVECVALHMSGC